MRALGALGAGACERAPQGAALRESCHRRALGVDQWSESNPLGLIIRITSIGARNSASGSSQPNKQQLRGSMIAAPDGIARAPDARASQIATLAGNSTRVRRVPDAGPVTLGVMTH
jgi:hypothetical protein